MMLAAKIRGVEVPPGPSYDTDVRGAGQLDRPWRTIVQHIGFHQAVIRFFVDNQTTGLLHVTSHRGSIDVESRPGHGVRFEIRLPVITPKGAQEVAHDGAGG